MAATCAALALPSSALASGDPCPSDPFAAAQGASANTVYYWNDVLTDAFEAQGGAPAPLARAAAMMNVGIYDVLNSVYFAKLRDLSSSVPDDEVCGWEPYLVLAEADPSVDADLAAAYAARDILTYALPGQASFVADKFDDEYGGEFQQEAYALGSFVANRVITNRTGDGSANTTPYVPDSLTPGAWRPTPSTSAVSCSAAGAATPNWGLVTPFTMSSGS